MSWAAGIVSLAYLTSESLTMKQADAPVIARMPMRLARACGSDVSPDPGRRSPSAGRGLRPSSFVVARSCGRLSHQIARALPLHLLELRLPFLHLANEPRVVGFVVAGGEHRHGGDLAAGDESSGPGSYHPAALRPAVARRALRPPVHDLEAVQAALDGAVVERRALRRLEADQLREPRVAGQEARGPAGEVLLQRVAQLRIERRQRVLRRRA